MWTCGLVPLRVLNKTCSQKQSADSLQTTNLYCKLNHCPGLSQVNESVEMGDKLLCLALNRLGSNNGHLNDLYVGLNKSASNTFVMVAKSSLHCITECNS